MRIVTIALASALAIAPAAAFAAGKTGAPSYTLTTTTYTQDFDSLASSGTSQALPQGFQIAEQGTSAASNGFYTANNGSSATGDTYSYGVIGSTERALGSLTSGTNTPIFFGGVFTNGLGGTIDSLTFGYDGEQWRAGNSPNDSLSFQYSLDASEVDNGSWTTIASLTFTPLVFSQNGATLNGNLAANRVSLTGSVAGLSIGAGQTFAFRWLNTDSTGSDHGLAADNFSIAATLVPVAPGGVPEPSTWALLILGFGAVGGALRRRRTLAFA
jgi:hypothetical protein